MNDRIAFDSIGHLMSTVLYDGLHLFFNFDHRPGAAWQFLPDGLLLPTASRLLKSWKKRKSGSTHSELCSENSIVMAILSKNRMAGKVRMSANER
jgi:hypothetical protein